MTPCGCMALWAAIPADGPWGAEERDPEMKQVWESCTEPRERGLCSPKSGSPRHANVNMHNYPKREMQYARGPQTGSTTGLILWEHFRLAFYGPSLENAASQRRATEESGKLRTTEAQATKPSSAKTHSTAEQKARGMKAGPAPPHHVPQPSHGHAGMRGTLRTSLTCKVVDKSAVLSLP